MLYATPLARKKRSSLPAFFHIARAYAPATASGLSVRSPCAGTSTPGLPTVAKRPCLLLENDQELRSGPELVDVRDLESTTDTSALVRHRFERRDILPRDHPVRLVGLRERNLAHLRLVDRGEVRRAEVARGHLRLAEPERAARLIDDLLLQQLVLRADHVVDRVALARQRRLLFRQLRLFGRELRLVLPECRVFGLQRGELRVERDDFGLLVVDDRLERGDRRIVRRELRVERGVVRRELLPAIAARTEPRLGLVQAVGQFLDLVLDGVALLCRRQARLGSCRRA